MRKKVVIQSSHGVVRKLCRDIAGQINPNYFNEETCFGIQLAIEEAMVNAVEHGNKLDPRKHITVAYSITPNRFEIAITDEGCGFMPETVPDPRKNENMHNVTGRGIVLMRALMDIVEYSKKGNRVRMIKRHSQT
jgi:serine/threonine-protein kinase RsbW